MLKRIIHVFSSHLSSFISYILFLRRSGYSRFWLCCKAIALMHSRGIYCSALLQIQMYYHEAAGCMLGRGCRGWGGHLGVAEKSRAAPRPQASRCMGAIIVAVNSAAHRRPCLNRPLRMVHYGPCWLQLSRGADLCTLAQRWKDEEEEWEKGD